MPVRSRHVAALSMLALLVASGCMRWQSVSVSEAAARPLPRLVSVTTTDSVHHVLERARFVGDTLIGRARDAADSQELRIPSSRIAHMQARLPSLPGAIGVGALVALGLWGLLYSIGHAA